jgi:hypothetical protein
VLKKERALWTLGLQQSNLRIQYWNLMIKSSRQRLSVKKGIKQITMRMNLECIKLIDNNKKSLTAAKANEVKKPKL